jgi:hypothetical protein
MTVNANAITEAVTASMNTNVNLRISFTSWTRVG